MFSLRSSVLPLGSWSILISTVLNSASGILVVSISFNSLSWDFSWSFIWGIFLCLLILSAFCACLCVLDRTAMTPKLLWWIYGVGVLWGSVEQPSRSPELSVPGMFLVCYVYPAIGVEPWMLLAHSWVELILRLVLTVRRNLDHHEWVTVQGLPAAVALFLAVSGACQSPPLVVPFVLLIGLSSGVVWSTSLLVLVLGALGRSSRADQNQTFCVTSFGPPVWSYLAIHSLWLCLLGLSVGRRDQTAQALASCHFELGADQWNVQGSQRSTSTCQLLCHTPEMAWSSSRDFQRETVEWA